MRPTFVLLVALSLTCWIPCEAGTTEQKPAVSPDDYGKWESLGNGLLSPDGQWLAYEINRVDGNRELRVRSVAEGALQSFDFGSGAAFSDDSKWLVFMIGRHEDESKKLKKNNEPVHDTLGLLDLETGSVTEVNGVLSFELSDCGRFLAMSRYPATKADKDAEKLGTDLVVRDLKTGRDTNFGSISDFAWQDDGSLLAMTVAAHGKAGNGVRVLDPVRRVLRVLDSGEYDYRGLAWRRDGDDLAVLRSLEDDGYEESANIVMCWKGVSGLLELDEPLDATMLTPTQVEGFPDDMRIVEERGLEWSDDGAVVFFGVKSWTKKPIEDGADAAAEEGAEEAPANGEPDETPRDTPADPEEEADVEIWHSKDYRIIPEQKLREERDRERSLLSAWIVDSGRVTQLERDGHDAIAPLRGSAFAVALDNEAYEFDTMFGRPRTDIFLVDVATGDEKLVARAVPSQPSFRWPQIALSAGGRYILFLRDDDIFSYDTQSGSTANLTSDLDASFVRTRDDHPVPQKPMVGVAGWLEDDRAVLLYEEYGLWMINPDGSEARKLTQGENVIHRYIELDPDEDFIKAEDPIYLSLRGLWTKQSGVAVVRLDEDDATYTRLLWDTTRVGRLIKGEHSETFAYVAQHFDNPPDYFVGGPGLADAIQVSELNPFQGDYSWGRSELVEFESSWGERLQGALYYPAAYTEGESYPMIVYIYEERASSVNRYVVPSDLHPYNKSVFTSQGYFVFEPDIRFQPRRPGQSALDCVEAGVTKVLESGMVKSEKIGIVGHSWGAYETCYLVTHSDLFAAGVAGAPLTNLISMYGSVYWNTGTPETDHFEVGQERMEVPFWEDLEAFTVNSPVFNITELSAPLLIAFGDQDGSVDWSQGYEMYNAARRLDQQLVLLVYPGENHSLKKKPNKIDYHGRVLEWFDHYLKGSDAPQWIETGVPYIEQKPEEKDDPS